MSVEQLVLVRGLADARATLERWNVEPGPVLRAWGGGAAAIAVGLLAAVYLVAALADPDPTPLILPGVNREATAGDLGHVLIRNLLVLALHSLACVAGFMAGSSMPQLAAARTGLSRKVHEWAGPAAIAFVMAATAFSLFTQAWILGHAASTMAAHWGIGPGTLLLALLPHALPELTALFLPLAAWVYASRRGRWDELLAATVATTALALPVLFVTSLVEIYVTPRLVLELIA